MAFDKKDHKNLLLNQLDWAESKRVKELVPSFSNDDQDFKYLTLNRNTSDNIIWSSIKSSSSIVINSQQNGDITLDVSLDIFESTNMHFSEGRIGIGRIPLHHYKVDIEVPVDTQMTALHIGDGTYGFSLGNAANTGFLPQIVGIGSALDDAGLYFLGKVNSQEASNIPALIFDARDINNSAINNRPIVGITTGEYSSYQLLVYPNGNLSVNGEIYTKNIQYVDSSNNILNLRHEIEDLKRRIYELENK
jgi:hypothetical protein